MKCYFQTKYNFVFVFHHSSNLAQRRTDGPPQQHTRHGSAYHVAAAWRPPTGLRPCCAALHISNNGLLSFCQCTHSSSYVHGHTRHVAAVTTYTSQHHIFYMLVVICVGLHATDSSFTLTHCSPALPPRTSPRHAHPHSGESPLYQCDTCPASATASARS